MPLIEDVVDTRLRPGNQDFDATRVSVGILRDACPAHKGFSIDPGLILDGEESDLFMAKFILGTE